MAGVKFQVFPFTFNVVLITLWHYPACQRVKQRAALLLRNIKECNRVRWCKAYFQQLTSGQLSHESKTENSRKKLKIKLVLNSVQQSVLEIIFRNRCVFFSFSCCVFLIKYSVFSIQHGVKEWRSDLKRCKLACAQCGECDRHWLRRGWRNEYSGVYRNGELVISKQEISVRCMAE